MRAAVYSLYAPQLDEAECFRSEVGEAVIYPCLLKAAAGGVIMKPAAVQFANCASC